MGANKRGLVYKSNISKSPCTIQNQTLKECGMSSMGYSLYSDFAMSFDIIPGHNTKKPNPSVLPI